MKPSDIILVDSMPLTAVFGRVEAEAAASYMIMTLVAYGDEWRVVQYQEMEDMVRCMFEKDAVPSWMRNPFFRPDLNELVSRGFTNASKVSRG